MRYKFNDGCMWEGNPWFIETDYQCTASVGNKSEVPCKHCHSDQIVDKPRSPNVGGTYQMRQWICPRIVIAMNEGSYNSTGICLDCLLEAASSIASERKKDFATAGRS